MTVIPETIHVLYVDDRPESCATVSEAFTEEIEVSTAENASAATRVLAEETVDCVVAAAEIDGTAALDFFETVQDSWPHIPRILFPATGSEPLASEAISVGVSDYVRRDGTDSFRKLQTSIEDAVSEAFTRTNYREIFEKATDGITLHDPDTGQIIDANPAFCEMLGYDRDAVIGMGLEEITADYEDFTAAAARERIRRAAEEGPQVFEWVDRTSTGEELPVEVNLRETTIGGRSRVLAIVRDVSERKRREQELETMRNRMAFALEATDSVVWEWAPDADLMQGHGPVDRVFGTNIGDIDGPETFFDRVAHPDDRDRLREQRAAILDGETDRFQHEFRTNPALGPERWIRSEGDVRVEDGEIRLVGISTDVTEDRESQRELKRKNERLEEFASIVSHDLRNPLNLMHGSLAMARDTGDPEHFDRCERAIERMERLVSDLLTLARQGESIDKTERIDLASFVRECWGAMDTEDAELTIEDDRVIEADESRLRHVVENLVRNAIEHAGSGEHSTEDGEGDDSHVTITVGALEGDGESGVFVADDGPGIPADERSDVFEAGYTTSDEGTGFGLNIVRDIVEAHDWDIRVVESENGGARFEITGVDP